MVTPDFAAIAEIIIFSEGFAESKVLANKFVKFFKLCAEQVGEARFVFPRRSFYPVCGPLDVALCVGPSSISCSVPASICFAAPSSLSLSLCLGEYSL